MTGPGVIERPAEEILFGFTRALRAAGVAVTADRAQSYVEAVALVGLDDPVATRTAGHATLCAGPDDLERHDRVFEQWFSADTRNPAARPAAPPGRPEPTLETLPLGPEEAGDAAPEDDPLRAAASAAEVLRHRDVAILEPAERARLAALFATLDVRLPRRRAPRRTPYRRGDVDAGRTLRASLRRMGEPAAIHRRHRSDRPRRVVLLIDISGSMSGYADALLRLAHRIVQADRGAGGRPAVEVFSIGTRLTHLTRALHQRDADRALAAAGEVVPDWSGGTRLGQSLQVFAERWGRRGMARGAVVVIFSDGWERGDATLLGAQVAALRRLAHRVIWVNPHRGKDGYAPLQQGIVAALPHLDDFLAGHSLATFSELVKVMADA